MLFMHSSAIPATSLDVPEPFPNPCRIDHACTYIPYLPAPAYAAFKLSQAVPVLFSS